MKSFSNVKTAPRADDSSLAALSPSSSGIAHLAAQNGAVVAPLSTGGGKFAVLRTEAECAASPDHFPTRTWTDIESCFRKNKGLFPKSQVSRRSRAWKPKPNEPLVSVPEKAEEVPKEELQPLGAAGNAPFSVPVSSSSPSSSHLLSSTSGSGSTFAPDVAKSAPVNVRADSQSSSARFHRGYNGRERNEDSLGGVTRNALVAGGVALTAMGTLRAGAARVLQPLGAV